MRVRVPWQALILGAVAWALLFLTGHPFYSFAVIVVAFVLVWLVAELTARIIIAATRCRNVSPMDKDERCVLRRGHPGLHESRSLMWGAPPGWRAGPLPHAADHEEAPAR